MIRARIHIVAVLLVVCLAGCAPRTHLIATPTIMLGERGRLAYAGVAQDRRQVEMPVIYAADRDIVARNALGVQYGSGRSGELVLGLAVVGLDRTLNWDALVAASTQKRWPEPGGRRPAMVLKSTRELGRLAIPLKEMQVRDGRYRLSGDAVEELETTRQQLHEMLAERLNGRRQKDVYLYVHGFNNTFEDAVFRMAMMWHFAGRVGVPIAYTWPAGRGGLRGYAYDRESGEFTVFHLKLFIKALAASPDVENLHIIAHSRGTDVVCTALRELNIEIRAAGNQTQDELKLQNLVLAAPDLDPDVFEQRFAIEDLHLAARRTTVYLSRADLALWLSKLLFGGGERLGNLTPGKFAEDARRKMSKLREFYLIDCNVSGFGDSHNYAFSHPAVASDLILLLRDNAAPGAAHGRPLAAPVEGIWEIDNRYLRDLPPVEAERSLTAP